MDEYNSIWDDPDMDMIRAILDEDHTKPRQMPGQADHQNSDYAPQPEYQVPFENPQQAPCYDTQPALNPSQPRTQVPRYNPQVSSFEDQIAAEARPSLQRAEKHRRAEQRHGSSGGKGTVAFLIILIALELAVILGVCVSWYLWTH